MGDLMDWASTASRTLIYVLAGVATLGVVLLGWRLLRQRPFPAIQATARDLAVALAVSLIVVLTLLSPTPVTDGREPVVRLVPFEDLREALGGRQSLRVVLEMIGNVALFVPLGWSLRWRFKRLRIVHVAAVAAAISVTIEALQALTGGGRWPETTDVITNTVGALLGAALAGMGIARSHE